MRWHTCRQCEIRCQGTGGQWAVTTASS